MKKRTIAAVITAITGDRVIVGEPELHHALEEHFQFLPQDMLLELVERILKEPTEIYEEPSPRHYHLFYRLNNGKYLVVVVKKSKSGNYFSSIYPTGKKIRNKHKKLKKVKL